MHWRGTSAPSTPQAEHEAADRCEHVAIDRAQIVAPTWLSASFTSGTTDSPSMGSMSALWTRRSTRENGQPVSKVCHRFEPLPQVTKNVRYRNGKPHEHAAVRSAIADGTERLNGQGRLIVRPSGTEPVIRVTGEGDDASLVEEVVDGVVVVLTEVAAA